MWSDWLAETIINPGQRLFWIYILSSMMIALLFTLYHAQHRTEPFSLRSSWFVLKNYLAHPSALLDYRFFFIGTLIKLTLIAPIIVSAKTVAITVFKFLAPYTDGPIQSLSHQSITILYTISLFITSDLSRYFLHRLLHTNKYLWQFHKIHHSAEVLNPLSFYRVHPIENLLFGLRYSLCVGLVTGIFLTLFGSRISLWTILGTNGYLFIFSLLGTHLRHSHLYIQYPRFLENFFISPAMHQIHHYKGHMLFNYGGYLAIWDKLFGSWKASSDVKQGLPIGFASKQMQHYRSISQLLLQPFRALIKKY